MALAATAGSFDSAARPPGRVRIEGESHDAKAGGLPSVGARHYEFGADSCTPDRHVQKRSIVCRNVIATGPAGRTDDHRLLTVMDTFRAGAVGICRHGRLQRQRSHPAAELVRWIVVMQEKRRNGPRPRAWAQWKESREHTLVGWRAVESCRRTTGDVPGIATAEGLARSDPGFETIAFLRVRT